MVMIARLKGIPFTRDEGDIRISLEKLPKSLNVFVNKAVRRHPMTIVLRQVRPNNATFTQGNFCWGASSNSISADGLNELSMKRVLLPLVSVGPTGQPIAVRRFAASLIGQWPVPPRRSLRVGPTGQPIAVRRFAASLIGQWPVPPRLSPRVGPGPSRLQRLQVLAWLEAYGFSRRDIYFRAGTRVPPDTGLPRLYRKYSEAAQLDPIIGLEGVLHAIEDRIHRLFRFRLAHSRPLNDLIHKIEFDHWNLRFRLKPATTMFC